MTCNKVVVRAIGWRFPKKRYLHTTENTRPLKGADSRALQMIAWVWTNTLQQTSGEIYSLWVSKNALFPRN